MSHTHTHTHTHFVRETNEPRATVDGHKQADTRLWRQKHTHTHTHTVMTQHTNPNGSKPGHVLWAIDFLSGRSKHGEQRVDHTG